MPETDEHSILLITGNSLRHKRFALRVQKEFGDLVVAWYELSSGVSPRYETLLTNDLATPKSLSLELKRVLGPSVKALVSIRDDGFVVSILRAVHFVSYKLLFRFRFSKKERQAEEELFRSEIKELEQYSTVGPARINPMDVHDQKFAMEVRRLDPYFFLSFSGPLYKKSLLQSVRGVAINQHSGHSPELKGVCTTDWALYHRNLNHVSSTVHITSSGADAGPIIRRSTPCILPRDMSQKIFARVGALGTELMIEVVHDIMRSKDLRVFEQPKIIGMTYRGAEYGANIRNSVMRDFASDWLHHELKRIKRF